MNSFLVIFEDILFIVGDGMINDAQLKETKGPFQFWEDNPKLREQLLNQ